MKWHVSPKNRKAMSDCAYVMRWSEHPGTKRLWFNAYSPSTKDHPEGLCIAAGFDKDECKQKCEEHFARNQQQVAA